MSKYNPNPSPVNQMTTKDRQPVIHPTGEVCCGECNKQIGKIENGALSAANLLVPNPTRVRCGTCFTPNYFVPPRFLKQKKG